MKTQPSRSVGFCSPMSPRISLGMTWQIHKWTLELPGSGPVILLMHLLGRKAVLYFQYTRGEAAAPLEIPRPPLASRTLRPKKRSTKLPPWRAPNHLWDMMLVPIAPWMLLPLPLFRPQEAEDIPPKYMAHKDRKSITQFRWWTLDKILNSSPTQLPGLRLYMILNKES